MVQAPRGADKRFGSHYSLTSHERRAAHGRCARGHSKAGPLAGTLQPGKSHRPHEGRCYGGQTLEYVNSLTKAREMHQLTEVVAPQRAVGRRHRMCLGLLNCVRDDGERWFIVYQLV